MAGEEASDQVRVFGGYVAAAHDGTGTGFLDGTGNDGSRTCMGGRAVYFSMVT